MTFQTTQQAYCQAVGTSPTNSSYISNRDPTSNDINFIIGKFWVNTDNQSLWYLNSFTSANGVVQADWESIQSSLQTLSDTANTVVDPSSGTATPPHNIQLTSLDATVTILSDAANNRILFSVNDAGFVWSDKSTSFPALSSNGYRATSALTAALPASPSDGDTIIINTRTASAVVILANTGQTISLGDLTSSSNGTLTSATLGSSVTLVYQLSATKWNVISALGTWAVA